MSEEQMNNPLNSLNEDIELERELEKEQLLEDLLPLLDIEEDKGFCITCEHLDSRKCIFLRATNDLIKIFNGRYKAKQIAPIEGRWGCTAHRKKETFQLEQ